MAKLGASDAVQNLAAVTELLNDLATLPAEVQDAMLLAEADVVYKAQHKSALHDLDEKGYGTGATAAALTIGKPSGSKSRSLFLTFKGKRGKGKARRNASTVAFFNEVGSKRIHARRWIKRANEAAADEALAAAAKEYDEWLNSH